MPTKKQLTPPLTHTVEIGDRFINRQYPDRIYHVARKRYNDDLTIAYIMDVQYIGAQKPPKMYSVMEVHESKIKSWPWKLAWRTKRVVLTAEKIFTGVFYGTS